jgi:hypothetical protein
MSQQIDCLRKLHERTGDHFLPTKISRRKNRDVERPNLEKPADVDLLFSNELNTCRYQLLHLLSKFTAKVTRNGTIHADELEYFLIALSALLNEFTSDSLAAFSLAWRQIIGDFLRAADGAEEDSCLLDLFARHMRNRYECHLRNELSARLADAFLEICKYEEMVARRKREALAVDGPSETMFRAEFSRLIADLIRHRQILKGEFRAIHKSVYDLVLRKIAAAKLVKFEMRARPMYTGEDQNHLDESAMDIVKRDIEKNKRTAQIMRIARALSGIASIRFYTKRIQSLELDRQTERAHLWEVRREFEIHEKQMLETLQESYRKLAGSEIEIEKLKQQLENEKQSTIQLVHWKAMNVKKEDKLEADLKKVESAGKIDVGRLLSR